MSEPRLLIKSAGIDFELTELLGEKPSDFIVLLADGEQFPGYGTPLDSPRAREEFTDFVRVINDCSSKSVWPEFFRNWRAHFIKHYKLPPDATSLDFHPVFSWAISRVVHGYSAYPHMAVTLIDDLGPRVKEWEIGKKRGEYFATLRGENTVFHATSKTVAMAVALAAKRLLTSDL